MIKGNEGVELGLGGLMLCLLGFQRDWDGHGSPAPDPLSIDTARQFIEDLYQTTLSWQGPHIGASEDGEVVLEWWHGDRKLTVYAGRDELTYIKSWGPHVIDDMEDGVISADEILALWVWLFE